MLLSSLSFFVVGTFNTIVNSEVENTTYLEESKLFSIQHAQYCSISEINETAYSLELNDVFYKTILFLDRLDRIVTSVSTDDFIGNWSNGTDIFAVDASNAVLIEDEI